MSTVIKQNFFGKIYDISSSIYLEFPREICKKYKHYILLYDDSKDMFFLKQNGKFKTYIVIIYKDAEYFIILQPFYLQQIQEFQIRSKYVWWKLTSKQELSHGKNMMPWVDSRSKVLKSTNINMLNKHLRQIYQLAIHVYDNHPQQELNIEYLLPYIYITQQIYDVPFSTHYACIIQNKHQSLKIILLDFKSKYILRISTDNKQLVYKHQVLNHFIIKDITCSQTQFDIYTKKLYLIAITRWYTLHNKMYSAAEKISFLHQHQSKLFASATFFDTLKSTLLQILSNNYIRHYRYIWRKTYLSFPLKTYTFFIFEDHHDEKPDQFIDSFIIMNKPHDIVKQDKDGYSYTLVWEILYKIRHIYIKLSSLNLTFLVKYRTPFLQLLGSFRAFHEGHYNIFVNRSKHRQAFHVNNKQDIHIFFNDEQCCFCVIFNSVVYILNDVHNMHKQVLPSCILSCDRIRYINIYKSYLQFFSFVHTKQYIPIIYQLILLNILQFKTSLFDLLSFQFEIQQFDPISTHEIMNIQKYL